MSKPSLAGWWQCSACHSLNNPQLSDGKCVTCNHARCRECFGRGSPYSVQKVEPKKVPDAVNLRRSLLRRLFREPRGRQKDEVNNDGVADKHEIYHPPSLSSNQVQTISHVSVQAEFPSTIPQEVEAGMPVLHSEFSPTLSPDGLQLDGKAGISHSGGGYYPNRSSEPRSARVGAGSQIAIFILEDERLGSILSEAYKQIDEVAFLRDLTKDLTTYANDLSLEGLDERKGRAGTFIRSQSNVIAREIYARIDNMSSLAFEVLRKRKSDREKSPEDFSFHNPRNDFQIESAEAAYKEPVKEAPSDGLLDDYGVFERSILSGPAFEDMIQRRQKVNPVQDEPDPGRRPDQTPRPRPTAVVGKSLSPWGIVKRACCELIEPSVPLGARRVRWMCCCGDFLWDDYSVDVARDIEQLQKGLDRSFRGWSHGSCDCRESGFAFGVLGFARQAFDYVQRFWQKAVPTNSRGVDLEDQPRTNSSDQDEQCQSMLLTSVTRGSGFPTLVQRSSASIRSDRDYFSMLKNIYEPKKWSTRWWLGVHTVVGIRYVRVSNTAQVLKTLM
jgi:hypothetical protein